MGEQEAGFIYLWRYEVQPGREAEFERLYGPSGDWAEFFGRSPAYLGTELLRATAPRCYITIDRWVSRDAHRVCVSENRTEWDEIDARGEALTATEELIGEFTPVNERNEDPARERSDCRRCGRRIVKHAKLAGDVFEGMHWLCFHLEFEHDGDPDMPCEDLSCPVWQLQIFREKLAELGTDPDELSSKAFEAR